MSIFSVFIESAVLCQHFCGLIQLQYVRVGALQSEGWLFDTRLVLVSLGKAPHLPIDGV